MSNQPNHSKPTGGLQKPLFVFAIIIIICLLAALAWLVLPANQKTTKATTNQPTETNQTQSKLSATQVPTTPQIQEASTQQHTLNNKATIQTAPNQTAPKPANTANKPAHEINPNTGLPYHKNDPAILQKRREVMTQLADIMDNTSKGRKADAQTLQNLVSEIKNIEKLGYFSPEDAKNTIEFIQKAYPNLDIVK